MSAKPPIVTVNYPMVSLPAYWRALLITIVVILGMGYCAALLNLYSQNEFADGRPGLSSQDLIVRYHGGFVATDADQPPPSRMLEATETDMRDFFSSDQNHKVVRSWLAAGAHEAGFLKAEGVSPQSVFEADCTQCHSADADADLAQMAPFGPDADTATFALVSKFTDTPEVRAGGVWKAPVNWRKLALVTHVHILAVPLFVVLMAGLFLWADWPLRRTSRGKSIRLALGIAPLLFFLGDVTCWWLARIPVVGVGFALTIGACGAMFGLTFMLQWSVVMCTLCGLRHRTTAETTTQPAVLPDRATGQLALARAATPGSLIDPIPRFSSEITTDPTTSIGGRRLASVVPLRTEMRSASRRDSVSFKTKD